MTETDHREDFRPAQGEIPTSPGVYRFADRSGRVLYIGKAKQLRNRVSNYFQPLRTLAPRTQRMLLLARSLDWTVVGSDTEALILEHTWIKEFEPPFNVQFRDDKSYPYLVVTLGDEAPRLIITRRSRIPGARYYGPYPKVWALKQLTAGLQDAFPIRTCNDADYRRAMQSGRPCLSGQIGRCFGPCSGKVTIDEHVARVRELVDFLNGHDRDLVKLVTAQMRDAAEAQEYERAATLRDQLAAIEHVLEHNAVVLSGEADLDVFGLQADELQAAVHQFVIRGGRIRGERSWIVEVSPEDSHATILQHALQTAYDDEVPPATILVPTLPESVRELALVLGAERPRGGRVTITVPARGEKTRILDRAILNATEQLMRHKLKRAADITARTDAIAELQQALGLAEPPLRIECIDVSHLQGTGIVASLVVFEDGLPVKGEYRKYRIESATDDTDSIGQVVGRRALQLQNLEDSAETPAPVKRRSRPGLLIVDGGQPQVNAAKRALSEHGITDVPVCGIAKRMEEIWLPGDPFPVILPRSSEALFLVQRARDEAHRFAITFQRQRRSTSIASQLSDIPGVGPQRIKQLLRHFGSVARLRVASTEEITSIPGFGAAIAQAITARLAAAESDTLDGDPGAAPPQSDERNTP